MNTRVVICHPSEASAHQLADALLKSRVVSAAEVSVGFERANELIQEANRVDTCLIDSSLLVKCLEKDRLASHLRGHSVRRIVLAPCVPNSLVIQAAQAGLDDVVDMSLPAEMLLQQLRDSLAGRHSLQAHPIWRSIHAPRDVHEIQSPYRDNIDREIVSMIATGLTDDEIAQGVYLSCQTVRNRISRMLERSGARNRTQLATFFVRDQYNELEAVTHAATLGNGLTRHEFALAN